MPFPLPTPLNGIKIFSFISPSDPVLNFDRKDYLEPTC